jgi:peptidoglycan/LPS O-acetylase OafA/YrhL
MRRASDANGRTQLPSLTGLRGAAALWVVLYHFGNLYFPASQPNVVVNIIQKGYLAVDLFFLLSGFVLAHVYLNDLAVNGPKAVWTFFQARIARLYPLHLLILMLFIIDAAVRSLIAHVISGEPLHVKLFGAQSVVATAANVLMIQGIKASELSWNYPTWSISVEFVAYLLFAIAAAHFYRPASRSTRLWLGFTAAWLVFFSWLVGGDFNQWDGWSAFGRCIPEFFIGVLLYVFARDGRPFSGLNLLTACLLVAVPALIQSGAPDLLVVFVFASMVPILVRSSGLATKILNASPIVLLGEVSYALYLIHGLVQITVSRLLAGISISDQALSPAYSVALMVGLVTLSLLFAYFAHELVELPARRNLKRQLGSRRAIQRIGKLQEGALPISAIPRR